jgi:hypothetical protein
MISGLLVVGLAVMIAALFGGHALLQSAADARPDDAGLRTLLDLSGVLVVFTLACLTALGAVTVSVGLAVWRGDRARRTAEPGPPERWYGAR